MVFTDVGLTGQLGLLLRSIGDNRSTMPAEASSMVELLSPIALPDALAAASLGFRGCWYYGSRGLIVPIDWGQSIYHASGGLFHGRAIVPNSSTTTRSGGVLWFSRMLV